MLKVEYIDANDDISDNKWDAPTTYCCRCMQTKRTKEQGRRLSPHKITRDNETDKN